MTSHAQRHSEAPAALRRRARLSASGHSFALKKEDLTRLISGFRRSVNEICDLLGVLRRVDWQRLTDVSGQLASHNFKSQAVQP